MEKVISTTADIGNALDYFLTTLQEDLEETGSFIRSKILKIATQYICHIPALKKIDPDIETAWLTYSSHMAIDSSIHDDVERAVMHIFRSILTEDISSTDKRLFWLSLPRSSLVIKKELMNGFYIPQVDDELCSDEILRDLSRDLRGMPPSIEHTIKL